MLTESCKKVANSLCCIICDYTTCRKSSYNKHVLTSKHIKLTNVNRKLQKSCKTGENSLVFTCHKCSKNYKSRVGLWKHNKVCLDEKQTSENFNKPFELTHETIMNIIKQNSEFQQMLLEQNKTIIDLSKNNSITNNTNNSHNNSHNKSFNLQFFLNETCKNAMNITDFVNSLQLQISDLEKVGEIGYVEGISNIIIKKLNALDVTLRPVHCTDKKRETMYVKDENKWEKEDDNKTKLHKMVRKVSNKNIDLITDFKELHPDWKKSCSKVSDQFDKIIIESMGGIGENDYEKEERIIKKVTKAVFVDKSL